MCMPPIVLTVYSSDYAAGRVEGLRTTGYKSVYIFQNLNN